VTFTLNQPVIFADPNGPSELRFTIDQNDIVRVSGELSHPNAQRLITLLKIDECDWHFLAGQLHAESL